MTDAVRYVLIAGGFVAIGLNLAIMGNLPLMVRAVRGWRLYLVGQSFFDLAAIVGVHHHLGDPLGWTAYLLIVAMLLTLASLAVLETANRRNRHRSRLSSPP